MEKFWRFSLLSGICFVAFCSACFAQDVIITKDSKKINAKVLEVNVDNIRYKNFDNADGPVYTILKDDIVSILYQNGHTDVFTMDKTMSISLMKDSIALTKKADLPLVMKVHSPALYKVYKDGERMYKKGNGLIAAGFFSTLLGVTLSLSANGINYSDTDFNNIQLGIGIGLLIAGEVFLAVGIPISAVGKGKKSGALKEFRQQYNLTSSPPSHFRFNLNANGVGVSYVFGNK